MLPCKQRGEGRMLKEEKQIITREKVRSELKRIVKGDLISAAFFWFLLISVNAILSLILYLVGTYLLEELPVVPTILSLLRWVTWLIPVVYPIGKLYKSCLYFQMINNDDFSIVEDELVRTVKDEFNVKHFFTTVVDADTRLISSYENAFYFDRYGRVVVGKKMFDYADCGDTFYLVVTNKKDLPVLVYNAKMYEYKENM